MLFSKRSESALGLCRLNRLLEVEHVWCCLLCLSKWAELFVSWREVSGTREAEEMGATRVTEDAPATVESQCLWRHRGFPTMTSESSLSSVLPPDLMFSRTVLNVIPQCVGSCGRRN